MSDLVPEQAVEALARAWFEAESATRFAKPLPWDSGLLAKARERQREWARAGLEAAVPLVLAAAYERLAEQLPRELGVDDAGDLQRALRGMASVLRGGGLVQCSGGVGSAALGPPERCALAEDHEGECTP